MTAPRVLLLLLLALGLRADASSPLPVSSSSSPSPSAPPDSVYATGFDALSPLNRLALVATIVVFLLLSALSGRELWRLRAPAGASLSVAVASGAGGSGAAATAGAKPSGQYVTPKHHSYGGIPTPQSVANAAGVSASQALLEDEAGASMSTGAEMRLRFFALLFVASTIRVAALVVEITTLHAMETSPAASLYSRLLSMFLWLPALLFVSMYGLVLLFWAHLCYACWGKFHPWPRRLFFAFNVLLYVVFAVLVLVTSTSGAFWRACDIMLGSIYLVGFVGMLYYSVRLIQFFRNQGPDEDFFFDLPASGNSPPRASPRQIVLRRITAVCVLLSVLFIVKASYMIGLGVGVVQSEETHYRSPVGVNHIGFEFAMHFFTEFIPCALLLMFTRKQAKAAGATVQGSGGNTTPALPLTSGGLTPGVNPHFGLRGRNNSSHSAYQDDTHSVGSGSLTGYQFQAVQRTYGSALTSSLRSTTTTTTSSTSSVFQTFESTHTQSVHTHAPASNSTAPSYV